MKLFELLDFHFKYGNGGAVKLKLFDQYGYAEPKIKFEGDCSDLAAYSHYLDFRVLNHEVELLKPRGFYCLLVELDFRESII
jgi:hypothetical protein